jgi:hypothetical protein
MARTDKREGRVKYYRIPALLENDQRKARFGKFADHPMLESVLICEHRIGIEGGPSLNDVTHAEFAKWFESRLLKARQRVAAFKKESRMQYEEMLRVIEAHDGDGVDPRRRIAIEEYHKTPLAIHVHRGVVHPLKSANRLRYNLPLALQYFRERKKVGKKLMKTLFKDEEGIVHWRFRPALDFQKHLEKLYPRHFPATETAESFMMFAKRAGLRFIGPKNAKTRKVSKRLKR